MYNDPNQPPQPPYGQPSYGQPPYGQPPQQPYGQPPQSFEQPPTQYAPSSYGLPPQQPPQPQQPYGVPPIPGQYPGYVPPPQQKKSLRWLWITLGILGGLVLIACAICGVTGVLGANLFKQTIGPAVVVEQYYQAVQRQDYATAYTYVSPEATLSLQGRSFPVSSQQSYTVVAQALDRSLGTVTQHSSHIDSSNTSSFSITVTRAGKRFLVHLTLTQSGNDWKITSADGI